MKKYDVSVLILTVMVLALVLLVFELLIPQYGCQGHWMMVVFTALLTYVGHLLNWRVLTKTPKRFNQVYLLTTTGKMFAVLIFMIAYLLIDRSQVIAFVLTSFVVYMIYTIYEVISLKNLLKSLQGNKN